MGRQPLDLSAEDAKVTALLKQCRHNQCLSSLGAYSVCFVKSLCSISAELGLLQHLYSESQLSPECNDQFPITLLLQEYPCIVRLYMNRFLYTPVFATLAHVLNDYRCIDHSVAGIQHTTEGPPAAYTRWDKLHACAMTSSLDLFM